MMMRRNIVAGLLLAASLACGTAAHAQPVTISYWNFFTGGDGGHMTTLVNDFNKSQSKVRVQAATLQWGVPFYTKTRAAVLAGHAPDLFSFHLSKMADWGSEGLLRPITEQELASVRLKGSDFAPHAWNQAHVKGALYAVPLDTHTLVLYVNLTLAKRAGLVDASSGHLKPITSMADFEADMRAIKAKTGAYGVEFASDATAADVWRVWYSLVRQQNAHVITNDKASYGAAGQTALAAMASWVKDGLMLGKLDPPTAPGLFLGGRSGFLLGGDWNRPTLAGAEAKHQLTFQYEILPLPKFYQTQRSWADSHSFAMPGKNNKLSPQKLAAVLQFVAYVEKHALIWAGGGHIPAYLPVTNSAAYRALKPNDEYRHAADIVAYDPGAWFAGVAGPLYQIAARDLNAGMNGQMPVDRAMTDMTEGINQIQR